MPSYTYNFFSFPGDIERPYLPIRIVNPIKNESIKWMCLVDTGADSSLITEEIAAFVGHNLKGNGVKSDVTGGVSGVTIPTWLHTFKLELQHPKSSEIVWSSEEILIDCVNVNEIPVLLGTSNFLTNFILNIDYFKKKLH